MADPHTFTAKATLADADEVYGQASPFGAASEIRTTWTQVWTNYIKPKADAAYIASLVADTTPQLGGMLDVNGNSLGDGTLEILSFVETASAVNEITVTNAATGNAPSLSATGDDVNISLNLVAKGTGVVQAGGNRVLSFGAGEINALTEKTVPVDADLVTVEDSADSNNKKKVQLGNIGTAMVTAFTGATAKTTLADDDYVAAFDPDHATPANRDTSITFANLKTQLNSSLSFVTTSSSDTLTNKTIDGDNNTISNLDLGNEVDWAAAADITDRTAFASGDKLLIFEIGVGLRKIDYDDLPGAAGGIANVVEDTSPQLGGMLDVNGNSLGDGTLELLKFSETLSAVNELTVTNAATGNAPSLSATGDDTNINLNLVAKGTGVVQAGGVAVSVAGKTMVPLLAQNLIPNTTNGAAVGTTETTTNKVMLSTLDFDDTTQESAQISIPMPKSWNEGTITAQFRWTTAATTGNVVWGIQAVAFSDDDALDAAFGTAQTVTDGASAAASDLLTSSETSAVTIAGTPAEGDVVTFRVYRDAASGSDTMTGDAKLIAVDLFITTNAANDA